MVMIAYILAGVVVATVLCLIAGRDRPWIAQAAFAGLIVASQITASKVGTLADGVYISAAVGLYSMTFLMTDYLSEIHGRDAAFRAVLMGLVATLVLFFAVQFTIAVEPAPFWANQEAMSTALGSLPRIMLASVIAYVIAQSADVWTFHQIKKLTGSQHLWLRNNASTFVGQTIDTVLFFGIALYGVVPNLIGLIVTTCIVKYIIALIDTPPLYLVRHLLTKSDGATSEIGRQTA